jgi:hypothetical protein
VIDLIFDVLIHLAWFVCMLLFGFAFGQLVLVPILGWWVCRRPYRDPEAETFVIDEARPGYRDVREKGFDE